MDEKNKDKLNKNNKKEDKDRDLFEEYLDKMKW